MAVHECDTRQITWAIPCLNEELSIAAVIQKITAACPGSRIIVFDNGSTDRTVDIAREHGAEVIYETRRGKGNVVRRMFRDCDSPILVMIDGDDTNDVDAWQRLTGPIELGHADMVIGCRLDQAELGAFRSMHHIGNRLLGFIMRQLFDLKARDVLSGYRAFSRRVYKSMAIESSGFEVETEMTLKAIEMKWNVAEVTTRYARRPPGSQSKLRTFHDGMIIGFAIFRLLKDLKPFTFFGAFALIFAGSAYWSWRETEVVFAGAFAVASIMTAGIGIILNAVAQRAKETIQLMSMRN